MKTLFSKGLILYLVFVALVLGGFLFLQLNGYQCFSSTETEHEGQTYGSSGHSHHHSNGYYHK